MAVAFDAAYPQNPADPDDVGFKSNGSVTTASWSHTTSGTQIVLVVDVCLGVHPSSGIGATASYANQSMTQQGTATPSGGEGFLVRFVLFNCPVGRNNVNITVTGGKAQVIGASFSFNGAGQSALGSNFTATGNSTTESVAVTSNTAGNIILSSCVAGATQGFPIGANGTRTWVANTGPTYNGGNGQGGTWAATGSSVTTSFPLDSAQPWAILSNEILSASTTQPTLTCPNINLLAGTFGSNSIAAQWWNAQARAPLYYQSGAPSALPMMIRVNGQNVAGNWLFCIVAWRQDAGFGNLQFPSTVTVSDDAGNWWIPVATVPPNTGIVRAAIWMAPAARVVDNVCISPSSISAGDAFQPALWALVFMTTAAVPWFSIEETVVTYANQATTLTVSQQNATTGLFSVGLVASDNSRAMPSTVSSGFAWEGLVSFLTDNLVDFTGDLQVWGFLIPSTAGSTNSITISRSTGTATADLAGVIITVHGVADAIPYPYATPLESWPTLVTEIASGPVINQNPLMITASSTFTSVTATATGTNTANGIALQVKVLRNANANPVGATVDPPVAQAPSAQITPLYTGSVFYGALSNTSNSTGFTALAGTQLDFNFSDATNGAAYGMFENFPSTAGVPVTLGSSTPNNNVHICLAEIAVAAGSTLATDVSSPSGVVNTAGVSVTSAAFAPPPGSLLIAMVGANRNLTAPIGMSVSDTSGLSWTQVAQDGSNCASIWIAQVPPLEPPANWSLQPANFLTGQSADFEGSIGTWVGSVNCTVAYSTATAYQGLGSLAITVTSNGTATAANTTLGLAPTQGLRCQPGDTLSASAWVLANGATRTITLQVEFVNSGGFTTGTVNVANAVDSTTAWTLLAGTVTATGNSSFARIKVNIASSALAGEIHYADNAFLYDGGFSATGPAGTLEQVTWPDFQPYPNYQALTGTPAGDSVALVPSGQNTTMQLLSEAEPVSPGLGYEINAWAFCPGNSGSGLTLTPQVVWYSGVNIIETDNGTPVQPGTGSWTNLTFPFQVKPPAGGGVFTDSSSIIATSTSGTLTITFTVAPTPGAKALIWVTQNSATPPSVSDNGTTPATWVLDVSQAGTTNGIYIFRADNITLPSAGNWVVTVTGASKLSGAGRTILGAANGSGSSTTGNATSSSVSTGSLAQTGQNGGYFFAAFEDNSTANPETIALTGTGFLGLQVQNNGTSVLCGAAAEQIVSNSAGAQTCTWTLGDAPPWNAAMLFYEAASGPATSAAAAVLVTTSNPDPAGYLPASAVVYIGYCGIGQADAYQNVSADELTWSDVSNRNFTHDAIQITRGIQYEQQSLEAGQLTLTLQNNDGSMMFGNLLSTYWPTIGDTDVPIRIRAIWPLSVTPYYVLFSGFTDDIHFAWDEGTWFGYAEITATDAWSRMTTQMLEPYVQEVLEDQPSVFTTLSNSGANSALSNITPMAQLTSNFGVGSAVATFSGSEIQLPGASSLANWSVTGVGTAAAGTASYPFANQGIALGYFPTASDPLPPVNGGVTCTFFLSTPNLDAGGTINANNPNPQTDLVICTAWSGSGPTWSLFIDNGTGNSFNTQAQLIVYDQTTGAGTVTNLAGDALFFFGTNQTITTYFAVTFTQTSVTVYQQTIGSSFPFITTVPANLAPNLIGFSLGGNAGPLFAYAGTVSTAGFWNSAFADFVVFPEQLPPSRLVSQALTAQSTAMAGFSEAQGELDIWRLARIIGYAGATPVVLQENAYGGELSLSFSQSADQNWVTPLTDTNGQITSSYFTNIASSTLAFMFVNGPGTLIYRDKLHQYNRDIGQWVLGDNPPQNLITNPLNTSSSLSPWHYFVGSPGTFTSSSVPSLPWFNPFCALFTNDGTSSNPALFYGALGFSNGVSGIVPGLFYQAEALFYSPQGWTGGVQVFLQYWTAGFSFISSSISPANNSQLAPGSIAHVQTAPLKAPNGAAHAFIGVAAIGVPPTSVQFYVTNVQFYSMPANPAGGPQGGFAQPELEAWAPEVPYLIGTQLTSDRALLFNQVILNQSGTNSNTLFSGSSIVFQPTSGVIVTIQNTPSVTARAGVPYTATLYLNNTAQQAPYVLSEPSMEDFGNWIVNTLSSPLLRPEQVAITPSSTPQAILMALGAEIADTVTYRRRPLGAPEIQILTYISKLTHTIDIASGEWMTAYELSPYPAGTIIECDDVIHGTLTGGNLLGF